MTAPAAALLTRVQSFLGDMHASPESALRDITPLLHDLAAYLAQPLSEEVADMVKGLRMIAKMREHDPGANELTTKDIAHAADMLDRLARAGQPAAEDARAAMNEVEAWATTLRQIIERDYGHEQQLDALVAKYGTGSGGALQRLERGIEELARAGRDLQDQLDRAGGQIYDSLPKYEVNELLRAEYERGVRETIKWIETATVLGELSVRKRFADHLRTNLLPRAGGGET